jgi:hypothetical protein
MVLAGGWVAAAAAESVRSTNGGRKLAAGLDAKVSFTLQAEPSQTERVHWRMFVFTRQPTTDSVAQ